MIPVAGHLLPLHGHPFGDIHIFGGYIRFPQHLSHLRIGGNTHDRFDGEVGIMGKVTGKVVGAKLVVGIEPFLHQVIGPGGQYLPVTGRIIGVSFHGGDSTGHDQHITRFLHRHIAAIGLSIGQGIGTHIMRRKRLGPFTALAVVEDRIDDSLQQIRVISQKQRGRGIGHIYRTDGTVAVVFFGEEQQGALFVLHQLVGCYRLTVSQGAEFSIF